MEVSAEWIRKSYSALNYAKIELHGCIERERGAMAVLKIREAALLATPGAIIGKNAETREAQLREGCKTEHDELEWSREARAKAQLAFDLAVMGVDELKLLIRLEEIELERDEYTHLSASPSPYPSGARPSWPGCVRKAA